ncbi:MAG: NUDIX domain-containing protein [Armatimonadetes bacterium]|nr:NUDIX domain-containing protein [Armatimonadota bacterium]NIM23948.1 NUDIX domain-containing protein [Armatimonadota bacterium]NIM67795.1 NUDIX domain-containing protein [Armatimonadota bacterium]NIM76335.1 NUDIX domain-containing protein [Armatimonadota bacterium]NIN06029.1 NUDIX domain-containing protein [Armatimonadota bacterium]
MKELCERIIASNEVFSGRLLRVRVEEVALPDGERAQREVVYHPGAIAVVPLLESGDVVMVRQFRLPTGKALLEIPAGVLEEGEAPEECVERELSEEIGMRPGRLDRLCSIYLAPGYSSEVIHLFLAGDLQPAWAPKDEDERLERVEVSVSEALRMIERGEIQDAKTIVGLLLATGRWAKMLGNEDKGVRDNGD